MGSNLAVLLLNKLLLTFWSFRQPVLLTFLHMASATLFTWGLWSAKFLHIQRIQSAAQLGKLTAMSLVFALAVLSANVSLKFLAVSMNQAIGAATPVFAAFFAFVCQGVSSQLPCRHSLCCMHTSSSVHRRAMMSLMDAVLCRLEALD
jgi:Triose-phosphate Transporter family